MDAHWVIQQPQEVAGWGWGGVVSSASYKLRKPRFWEVSRRVGALRLVGGKDDFELRAAGSLGFAPCHVPDSIPSSM